MALLQGMVFYGPIATLYRQARGVGLWEISLIEGISLALCIALEVPWGIAADRIGYKRTMVLCSWLYLASKVVFWRARGFWGFLAERVLLSVVTAGYSGVDTSLLYLSCEAGESQKAFGIYSSAQMAGLLAASAVFSLWVRDDGALAALLTVGSYGLAAALSLGLREVRPAAAETRGERAFGAVLRETLGNRRLLLLLLAAALLSECHQTVTVFLNQPQYRRCGLGAAEIGYLYIAATLLGMAGRWSAAVTKRLGVRRALALFGGAGAAACLTLAVSARGVPSAAAILLLRLENTWFQPLQLELQNRQITTRHRATALSVHAMVLDAAAAGTNLAFGALAERGLPWAFGFGAALCAASFILFALWLRGAKSGTCRNFR